MPGHRLQQRLECGRHPETRYRITRSVRDLATLLDLFAEANASLVTVGESLDTQAAAGRMVVHMLGVVTQRERETIAERTRSTSPTNALRWKSTASASRSAIASRTADSWRTRGRVRLSP